MSKADDVRVRQVVCAVYFGTVVNPGTVQAQVQGAVIFGITAGLYSDITLRDGRVEPGNFDTYQELRMNEAPGRMEEPGTSEIVPAVANAIFAAIGQRLRTLPVNPARLKHA